MITEQILAEANPISGCEIFSLELPCPKGALFHATKP